MYLYIHDQTLRLMNQGYVGAEIAEMLEMPPALAEQWHTHGYYGSVSHNVKAVYQRYMGWYDGNPANLWPHPPAPAARRYVKAMGGADGAFAVAQRAFDEGDYRWAIEVCKHIVFADETHDGARQLLADAFEQIGYGAECGTWRSAFMSGALELREGNFGTPTTSASSDLIGALTVSQIFDSVAVRVDGPRAWETHLVINWFVRDDIDDAGEHANRWWVTELRNGTLHHRRVDDPVGSAAASVTIDRTMFAPLLVGVTTLADAMASGAVEIDGDASVLGQLMGLLGPVDPAFPIVTPRAGT